MLAPTGKVKFSFAPNETIKAIYPAISHSKQAPVEADVYV